MTSPVMKMMIVMVMIRREIRTRNITSVVMTVRQRVVTTPVRVSPVRLVAVAAALIVMKFLTRQHLEDNGHWERVMCNDQSLKHLRL